MRPPYGVMIGSRNAGHVLCTTPNRAESEAEAEILAKDPRTALAGATNPPILTFTFNLRYISRVSTPPHPKVLLEVWKIHNGLFQQSIAMHFNLRIYTLSNMILSPSLPPTLPDSSASNNQEQHKRFHCSISTLAPDTESNTAKYKSHPNPCISSYYLTLGPPFAQDCKEECQGVGNGNCKGQFC